MNLFQKWSQRERANSFFYFIFVLSFACCSDEAVLILWTRMHVHPENPDWTPHAVAPLCVFPHLELN